MKNFLGIEIGGTKLQIVLGDESATISERLRLSVSPTAGAIGIRQQIETGLTALLKKTKPSAIGIGFGGPVDWQTGQICCSHQVPGWSEFPIAHWLHTLCGIPVFVDNDANVAALGEGIHGAGSGCNPVFYVTLGSGVGGGAVVDRKIYHGVKPGESEIGHIRLDKSGTTLESRCSGWAVDKRLRAVVTENPDCALSRLIGNSGGNEARFLKAALDQQDPFAKQIFNETADDLALALSHVAHLFHPERMILGGGLSLIGEPLRAAVEISLSRYVMEAFTPRPKICLSKLGEDAVPMGSLE
ncbi:MAG: ROK family protein, partial [Verrucomicrobiota bacterium]